MFYVILKCHVIFLNKTFYHAVIILKSAHAIQQCSISKVNFKPYRRFLGPCRSVRGLIQFSVDYYKLEHGTVGLTFPCYQSSLAPGQVTQHKGKGKA